jgi:uncharacterized membrane protein (DUF485 family)
MRKNTKMSDYKTKTKYNQELGFLLFMLYGTVYAGFVIISVYDVGLMDRIMPFEINLAVFYGMGLIVLALLLSIVYSGLCNSRERKSDQENQQ